MIMMARRRHTLLMNRMKKFACVTALCLWVWAHVVTLEGCAARWELAEEPAPRATQVLYVERNPWERWAEVSPDGEPTEYRLYFAVRGGVPLWVLREGGHYMEECSATESTVDRELTFEEGVSLLARCSKVEPQPPEYIEL